MVPEKPEDNYTVITRKVGELGSSLNGLQMSMDNAAFNLRSFGTTFVSTSVEINPEPGYGYYAPLAVNEDRYTIIHNTFLTA